jgi:serine/threonine-protein kinase
VQAVERDVTTGAAHFACGADGTLAMVPGSASSGLFQVTWVDRKGAAQPLDLAPGGYHDLRLSPDATRVAFLNGLGNANDVWIYDITRHTNARLTFTGNAAGPVWSNDGKSIFFTSFDSTGRSSRVYRKPVDGSREAEAVAVLAGISYVSWVSKNESEAVVDFVNQGAGMGDIVRLALRLQAKPSGIVADPADTYGAAVSPDDRWVAYHSDASGRFEIYVRDMTGQGGQWQVSSGGGEEPHWSRDGRELFFRAGNRMMAAPIDAGDTFHSGTPRLLFQGVYDLRTDSLRSYDVDPLTGRFLMVRPIDEGRPQPSIRLAVNWLSELRRLLPNSRSTSSR